MAEAVEAKLVPVGSAGVEVMALIVRGADIYLHSGCSSMAFMNACRHRADAQSALQSHRLEPQVHNQADTYMPQLLICLEEHAEMDLSRRKAVQPSLNSDCQRT